MTSKSVLTGLEPAGPDETAAVAVAISAHLRDSELAAAAAATEDDKAGWLGRKWQYAERLDRGGGSVRVPDAAPVTPWTASGRVNRL